MQQQERSALQTEYILKEYFGQIRFARAAELARSHRYLEAKQILAPNGKMPSDPRELDLLARIAANQKHFDEARRLWEEALRQVPDDPDFKHAMDQASSAKRVRHIRRVIIVAFITAIATAGLILTLVHFKVWGPFQLREVLKNAQPKPTQSNPVLDKR